MNVRRGSIHAGLRGVAGGGRCRDYPRFVASCTAVRPWFDLCSFAGGRGSSESTLGERATRRVFDGRTSARLRMRAELALWWEDGRPREDCLGGGDRVECGESCEGCASLVRRRHCRLRLFLE